MSLNVRGKLIGGFSIVIALLLISGGISYFMFSNTKKVTENVSDVTDLNTFLVAKLWIISNGRQCWIINLCWISHLRVNLIFINVD